MGHRPRKRQGLWEPVEKNDIIKRFTMVGVPSKPEQTAQRLDQKLIVT
jgi:hypothetical protein